MRTCVSRDVVYQVTCNATLKRSTNHRNEFEFRSSEIADITT